MSPSFAGAESAQPGGVWEEPYASRHPANAGFETPPPLIEDRVSASRPDVASLRRIAQPSRQFAASSFAFFWATKVQRA